MNRRLVRHAWVLVLVVGIALFLLDERTMVDTDNPNFVPSAIPLTEQGKPDRAAILAQASS